MSEKTLNNIRIVNKHDTEANWQKATGFTPKQGEVIVYDIDENYSYERIKIGDGKSNINDLPFIDKGVKDWTEEKFLNKNDAIPVVYTEGTDTVVWTGNEVAFDIGALKLYYYISDATPTIDDFANGAYIDIIDDIPFEFPVGDIFVDDNGAIHISGEEMFIINNDCVGKEIESMGDILVFPYAGVYMNENFVDHIASFVIPGYTGFGARKVIDPKYIPDLIKLSTVTMFADAWEGDSMPYSQTITCNGVTTNSKIDLQPTAVQIVELQNNEITLMLQNDGGVVTAWAIGNKPTKDYKMQVLITEVVLV